MKQYLISLLRQWLFWILFFNFTRLIFLIYHYNILNAENINLSEVLEIFLYSFKLDNATTCYLIILPFILLLVQWLFSVSWIHWLNRIYSSFMIILYSLTAAGEMGIYSEWKTKLTYKVLKYFTHPSEIYNSAGTGVFFFLLVIFILTSVSGIIIYNRWFYHDPKKGKVNIFGAVAFTLITPALLFIGLRGGIQQIPINQSQSFYSGHNILNCASVNNLFNLYISIFENLQNFDHNPYVFMSKARADSVMMKLYSKNTDSTQFILKTTKPNIVLIILESWSADLIESLGGEPGITPEFRKLEKNGILFDQVYASGSRSEQGMASIFSGFPAHPVSSITVQPDKIVALPSLVKELKKSGYYTAFYFGGQLIYGNIKSFMIYQGFNKIMEGADFPSSIPAGKLGIHDGFTLSYLLHDIAAMKPPFFASLFTLSTHSPWDQPFKKPLNWGENEHEYINAAYYTDHCLGEFFRQAKKEPWFPETLFILVADHSHNSYRNWHPQSNEYHKIPLLFYGDVIKEQYQGIRWSKSGNQHDLARTILNQLGSKNRDFPYSKDLLNPGVQDFAYFSTEDGVGWVRPEWTFTYETGGKMFYPWTSPGLPDSVKLEGFAYLQTVFSDYMNR